MPSTSRTRRRRAQRGVSLVESAVAAALMGVGVVAGLTAWDVASTSASRAVLLAWANCIVRSEADAILAAPYAATYGVPSRFVQDRSIQVVVLPVGRPLDAPRMPPEQLITVSAHDPRSNTTLAQVTFLKSSVLAGSKVMDGSLSDVGLGCPAR